MAFDERVTSDVLIVGAGMAGVTAAIVLGRAGVRVTLLDPQSTFPSLFRAEKIEPDQAELLRKFDLLDCLKPWRGDIGRVLIARGDRVAEVLQIEQYGIYYYDMVNELRRHLPPTVQFHVGRVRRLETSDQLQHITLADDTVLAARLVVLATGAAGKLHEQVGVTRRMLSENHSLSVGFTVRRPGGASFPWAALTYYPLDPDTRVDYLTLFAIRDEMRANLFLYRDPKDPWVRAFVNNPVSELAQMFPKLADVIGSCQVTSKVEMCPIDLYVTDDAAQPGAVLVGDAYQGVCPTTGTGLSKVLTDVDVLCTSYVPAWLGTPGMDASKIAQFYADERKIASDRHSLEAAFYHRRYVTDESLPWRLRRARDRFAGDVKEWFAPSRQRAAVF